MDAVEDKRLAITAADAGVPLIAAQFECLDGEVPVGVLGRQAVAVCFISDSPLRSAAGSRFSARD